MRYELSGSKITFFIENPKGEVEKRVNVSFAETQLSENDVKRLCNAVCKQAQGRKPISQHNFILRFVNPLLAYFKENKISFPVSSDVCQLFLLEFFNFYLTSTAWTKASASTRMGEWRLVKGGIEFWIDEEILPCDLFIPNIRHKIIQSNAKSQPLLGHTESKPTHSDKIPQKLLVNIDFAKSDVDYLDNIERDCKQKISIIREVCLSHWNAFMHDGQEGKLLALSVSQHDICAVKSSGCQSALNFDPPQACFLTHPQQ